MKTSERHRLKENEVALTVARVKETFEVYQKPILASVIGMLAIVVVAVGLMAWRSQSDTAARTQLADATATEGAQIIPPVPAEPGKPAPQQLAGSYPSEKARSEAALAKFVAVANAHPSAEAGIAARYHAAALLITLGRGGEAAQRYQEVIDRAGSSIYGQMARLGLADAQVATGKFDAAIATFKDMSSKTDGPLPVDGILMQLGRAYSAAGKQADARQTFKRVVDEFPQSPYAGEAKKAMDLIKG
jgi:TolA-binding protein